MNVLPKGRQAEYTLLDIKLSLARRCEHYSHKLGPDDMPPPSGKVEYDPEYWLMIRTAEMVRKCDRGRWIREGKL